MNSVSPSGADFATYSAAMPAFAPGLFSTMTGVPELLAELLGHHARDEVDRPARREAQDEARRLALRECRRRDERKRDSAQEDKAADRRQAVLRVFGMNAEIIGRRSERSRAARKACLFRRPIGAGVDSSPAAGRSRTLWSRVRALGPLPFRITEKHRCSVRSCSRPCPQPPFSRFPCPRSRNPSSFPASTSSAIRRGPARRSAPTGATSHSSRRAMAC